MLAFKTGSKILIDKLKISIGGGGTNTAATFAKFGLKTAYLGKVGKGHNSKLIINELKAYGINTSLLVKSSEGHSGFSIILEI